MRFLFLIIPFVSFGVLGQASQATKIKAFTFQKVPYSKIPDIDLSSYKSAQTRENQDPNLALGISLSGGGSRAQYFSTGVLIGLDDIKTKNNSTILKEVDYFSTVSGGGLAAGNYIALLNKRYHDTLEFDTLGEFWNSSKHFEDKNFDERMNVGTKTRYLVTRFGRKRMNYSHHIYKHALLNKQAKPRKDNYNEIFLHELMVNIDSSQKVNYPFLVPNASIYTNGDLFPMMPHIIDSLKIIRFQKPSFKIPFPRHVRSRTFINGFPLQYALGTSSAFPAMLPVYNFSQSDDRKTSKKSESIIKAFDGGLTDNLGVQTLSKLLKKDTGEKSKKAIVVNSSGKGIESLYTNTNRLKLFPFLTKSALYAVDINVNQSIQNLNNYFGEGNFLLFDLSDYKSIIDVQEYATIGEQVKSIIDKESTWEIFEDELLERIKGKGIHLDNEGHLSTMKKHDFEKLNGVDAFYIFELACNVDTKLRIEDNEREILILAGRYMVYKKEFEIKKVIYE